MKRPKIYWNDAALAPAAGFPALTSDS